MEHNLQIFKSDRFDVNDTARLSLFIYPSSLFAFTKKQDGLITTVFKCEDFDWKNSEEVLESLLTQLPAIPSKVFFHNPIFTLLPKSILLPGNEKDYLSLLGEFPQDSFFFSTPIDSGDLSIVSFLPAKIEQMLKGKFSDLEIFHGLSSFLSYVLHEKPNQLGQEIIVNCCDSFIYLAGFSNRELVVVNRFEVLTLEEILKYILITQETLKFEKKHVRVTLFGSSTYYELTESIGNQFFANFRMTRPYTNQRYSPGFNDNSPRKIFESFWEKV